MYKFTPGKEMEELKELFEKGRIEKVHLKKWCSEGKINKFVFDNFIKNKLHVFAGGVFSSRTQIHWEKTAKLVKEEKMEKVLVKSWEDLSDISGLICTQALEKENLMFIDYKNKSMLLYKDQLISGVDILNALGGNFEYQVVEVIDSYERLFEFMGKNELTYRHWNDRFYKYNGLEKTKIFYVEEIEKHFNVDLQILRGE